jgi:hypothetical protein
MRNTVRRLATAIVTTAAVAAVGAPAFAAPVNAPNTESFPVNCPALGGSVVILVPPGNGNFSPGFIVGTHQVVVPYKFVFTLSSGGTVLHTETIAKKAPLPAGAFVCTFSGSETQDGVTTTFSGVVTAVLRGKP